MGTYKDAGRLLVIVVLHFQCNTVLLISRMPHLADSQALTVYALKCRSQHGRLSRRVLTPKQAATGMQLQTAA